MSSPLLCVDGLSKRYCRSARASMAYALRDIGGELRGSSAQAQLRPGEFWALDEISFTLCEGESLAVAGHNGAGKSTLLKVLHGLLKPDRGEVRLRGRVEALIELGAGFNPVLTGRENVDLWCALNGLGARETRALLDRVVDFSELDAFIDTPLSSYSSGMRARLAFALSVGLEPDLLLVDEALAVGDHNFQRKCLNHMRAFVAGGGALLFVSHNSYQVQAVCERGILLDHGRIAFSGSAVETMSRMLEERTAERPPSAGAAGGEGPLEIRHLTAAAPDGGPARTGEPLRIALRYRAAEPIEIVWGFSFWTLDQWICITGDSSLAPLRVEHGEGELACDIPRLPLLPGRYAIRAAITEAGSLAVLAESGWKGPAATVDVTAPPDLLTNAQTQLGQLVTLDVDWTGGGRVR